MERNINKTCDCNVINQKMILNASKNALKPEILAKMCDFYKAFSDNTRLKIINVLNAGELCVGDIAVLVNMTKSAVSHQLSYLKDLLIVKSRKEGKIVFYSLSDKHVKILFEICREHIMEIV